MTTAGQADRAIVVDDLDDLPPLGSRCALSHCEGTPTHVVTRVYKYPTCSLTHALYFCEAHHRPRTES